MKKNPKTIAGLIVSAVLLTALLVMAVKTIPVVQEVRREISLTPTPLPPVPDSVMAVTPDPSQPTAAPAFCSDCGTKLDADARFCPGCGKRL